MFSHTHPLTPPEGAQWGGRGPKMRVCVSARQHAKLSSWKIILNFSGPKFFFGPSKLGGVSACCKNAFFWFFLHTQANGRPRRLLWESFCVPSHLSGSLYRSRTLSGKFENFTSVNFLSTFLVCRKKRCFSDIFKKNWKSFFLNYRS